MDKNNGWGVRQSFPIHPHFPSDSVSPTKRRGNGRLTCLFEGNEGRRLDEVLVEEGAEFRRIVVDVREDEGTAQRIHHFILLAVGGCWSAGSGDRRSSLLDAIEHKVMSDANNVSVVHCVGHSTLQSLLMTCESKVETKELKRSHVSNRITFGPQYHL